ncbi:MAG: lactate racemase domain-containing protein, partial [Planctomycetota bacterium]
MPITLPYGADSSVRLEPKDGALLAECGEPHAAALDDPGAATTRALDDPLGYPPLELCLTPGDRIVLPLGRDVPRAGEIVAAVVGSLLKAGVHPDGLTLLRTQADSDAGIGDPRPWLGREAVERLTFTSHVPTRRNELGYLAAMDSGEPIVLNRAITDSDVVLPIGCYHSRTAAGYYGIHSAVFPTFSDERTIQRFRSPTSLDPRGRPKKKPGKLVDHVGWLLGVTLTVQVIPGPGDRVLNVVAGQIDAVRRRAQRLYRAAWRSSAPRRASLVVATIEGGPSQQTWENVGRALAASGNLVEDGGAIAVCC